LPEPLSLEPLSVEKRVFVEDWEKRIFGIHVAMMGWPTAENCCRAAILCTWC
jgi:Nitrile hydratase beta subunit